MVGTSILGSWNGHWLTEPIVNRAHPCITSATLGRHLPGFCRNKSTSDLSSTMLNGSQLPWISMVSPKPLVLPPVFRAPNAPSFFWPSQVYKRPLVSSSAVAGLGLSPERREERKAKHRSSDLQTEDIRSNNKKHGSLNVPIEHHPTIRHMVYNGYYKVMSNIPRMGQLPTPEKPGLKPQETDFGT